VSKGSSYTGKINQKPLFNLIIHVFFVFLIELLSVEKIMGDDFTTFKGYCNAEHMLDSGQRVGVLKTTILHIRWMLEKEQSQVTHVRFCDLTVTNLKSGKPVAKETVNSQDIPMRLLSPIGDIEGRLQGAVWIIDKNELPVNNMREFVDYRVSGIAVELSGKKEVNRKNFNIFLMRDYKSVQSSSLKDVENWTVGPSALISKDSTPMVYLRDTMYDSKLGRILTIYNYGNLSITNGEIVFDEIPDRREVFYLEMINEEYKRVNGSLKRFWEYKKQSVDPLPYGYKTIYERGFQPDRDHQ
jgi:hypothetical protein